jgi:hypothetical protein
VLDLLASKLPDPENICLQTIIKAILWGTGRRDTEESTNKNDIGRYWRYVFGKRKLKRRRKCFWMRKWSEAG